MNGECSINSSFLAGVTLAAYQEDNGTLRSLSGAVLSEWPSHLTIDGVTFTLEVVERVGFDDRGTFFNAEYC